jgi:hypothetical protein
LDLSASGSLFNHLTKQFEKALKLTPGFINTLVICISARDRIGTVEISLPKVLDTMFGDITKNTILVITNCDIFSTSDQYKDWLKESMKMVNFGTLAEECGFRIFPCCAGGLKCEWLEDARAKILDQVALMPQYTSTVFTENIANIRKRAAEAAADVRKEGGNGGECIALHQEVIVDHSQTKQIFELQKGDAVLTDEGL